MSISECCCCGSLNIVHLPKISDSGLANNLEEFGTSVVSHSLFRLGLSSCEDCGHVQLSDPVDPKHLFAHYSYKTGVSRSFREHFAAYAKVMSDRIPGKNRKVLDVGFNDGCLLDECSLLGWETYGVDPAENLVRVAQEAKKHEVALGFFGEQEVFRGIKFDAITANNVFAHTRSINPFLRAVKDRLKEGGSFIFEVQYLPDLLENSLFDMIYHEHTSYHHLSPLERCIAANDLAIYDVERIGTHGGSIRVYTRHAEDSHILIRDSVKRLYEHEKKIIGESPIDRIYELLQQVKDRAKEATELLNRLDVGGQIIVGYTAPAKATTFLSCLPEETRNKISFIVDDSTLKQGLYIPGTDIIVTENARLIKLVERMGPSNISIIVFAWNIATSVKERLAEENPLLESCNFYTLLPRAAAF